MDKLGTLAKQLRQKEAWLRAILDAAADLSALSRGVRSQENPVPDVGDLLWQSDLGETERRRVDIFKRAVMHLVSLENELIDLSSVECGDFRLEMVDFDLKQVIDQTFDRVKRGPEARRLLFKAVLASAARRRFAGDPVRFQGILGNLLDKAVRGTKAGLITVTVRVEDDNANHLRLEIITQRTGHGDDELDELLSSPLYSESHASSPPDISDLRLDLCRQLVREMGGELVFGGETGDSAFCAFDVVLHAAMEDEYAAARQHEGLSETGLSETEFSTSEPAIRVLIAEDSADSRFLLEVFLKGGRYEITFAENGKIAVEAAEAQTFDLILMDIQMPVMDGLTATRLIRRAEQEMGRTPTPLLALTGNSRKSDIGLSMAAGCDEHILKPISRSELLKTIEKYVSSKARNDARSPSAAERADDFQASKTYVPSQPETVSCANLC